jgi:ribonuclease-3
MDEGAETGAAEGAPSKDPVFRLMALLGHRFANAELLTQALTHRSYVNECAEPVKDNERLEYLGDAVIDLIVSVELMRRFPDAREGQLSKLRASIVSEAGLADVAERLELGDALRVGRGEEISGGRAKPSILSDAFEAVIAAVFLDAGLDRATEVMLAWFRFPERVALERADPKTELQQRIQAELHITPTYRVVAERGPDHDKVFQVELVVGGEVKSRGEGRTKKEAEQAAAGALLDQLSG